jgi:hypothetical protein
MSKRTISELKSDRRDSERGQKSVSNAAVPVWTVNRAGFGGPPGSENKRKTRENLEQHGQSEISTLLRAMWHGSSGTL